MANHDMAIRLMQDDDSEAVIDLLWQLNCFEHGLEPNRSTERTAAAACLAVNRQRVAAGGAQYVATVSGQVVAYGCCVIDMAPAYIREDQRRHVWIADLVVTAAMRGSGIGSALLGRMEDFAREQGIRQVLIGALAANEVACRLYGNLGYRSYSVERLKTLD